MAVDESGNDKLSLWNDFEVADLKSRLHILVVPDSNHLSTVIQQEDSIGEIFARLEIALLS